MASLWMRRKGLLKQLDRLVASGRITSAEANRLREASNGGEFDAAVQDISVRHAQAELDAAVKAGEMSEDEACRQLDRLRNGEHRRSLRGHMRNKSRSIS